MVEAPTWHKQQWPQLCTYDAQQLAMLELVVPKSFTNYSEHATPPVVNNMVHVVKLLREANIMFPLHRFMNSSRRRTKFKQVSIRYTQLAKTSISPVVTILAYESGNLVICGTRSAESVVWALQMMRMDLAQCGVYTSMSGLAIVNVVVQAFLDFPIDLRRLVATNGYEASYEDEEFPGVMLKVDGVRVLAFENGKFVLTGARSYREQFEAARKTSNILAAYKLEQRPAASVVGADGAPVSAMRGSRRGRAANARKAQQAAKALEKSTDAATATTDAPLSTTTTTIGTNNGRRRAGVTFHLSSLGPVVPGQEPPELKKATARVIGAKAAAAATALSSVAATTPSVAAPKKKPRKPRAKKVATPKSPKPTKRRRGGTPI